LQLREREPVQREFEMDWRLFLSTFLLIFLSELGDKTQLAAMAAATEARSIWTVFFAASLALVASTLLAVLFGEMLQTFVPRRVIQFAAAGLFLAFGVVFLVMAIRGAPPAGADEEAGEPTTQAPARGPLAALAYAGAAAFEEAAHREYAELAELPLPPAMKRTVAELAAEERRHLDRLHALAGEHPSPEMAASPPAHPVREAGEAGKAVGSEVDARQLVADLVRHEEATAAFYRSLAERAAAPSLRDAFRGLAREEADHARRLRACVDHAG
jgi:rubrerythrin